MTEYEVHLTAINNQLNRLEPFFRAEFSPVGGSIMKVINRNQHKSAHLIMSGPEGTKHARITNAVRWELDGYNVEEEVPTLQPHVSFYLTNQRYRLNAEVDYLFAVWNEQQRVDVELTKVIQLDTQVVVNYLDKYTRGGNKALAEAGLPVINGYVSLPIGLLEEMGAIVNSFTINWSLYSYENINGEVKALLSRKVSRAWSHYALAMTPKKTAVVAFCKATKQMLQFESETACALELMIDNTESQTEFARKRMISAAACVNRCVHGASNKIHGKDGLWYVVFSYEEAKKLEAEGTLKEAIEKRYSRKPRTKKVA